MEYENLDDIVFALEHYSELLEKFPDNLILLSGKVEILEGIEGTLMTERENIIMLWPHKAVIPYYDKILLICKDESLKNKTLQKKLRVHIKQKDKREFLLASSRHNYVSEAYSILQEHAKGMRDAKEREFFYDWCLELRSCDEDAALGKALALAERDVNSALEFSKQKFESRYWGHYIRASIFRKLGQYELAIENLNAALSGTPESATLFERFKKEKIACLLAFKKIDDAVSLAPTNLEKAHIYYAANDLTNTVLYATKSIKEGNHSKLPYMLIGRAKCGQGKFSDAAKWLKQWTGLEPQNAESWYWLGQAVLKS